MNWKNILERALWTFVEGFLTCITPVSVTVDVLYDVGHFKAFLMGALLSSVLAGVMGGLSALKTVVIDVIKIRLNRLEEAADDGKDD